MSCDCSPELSDNKVLLCGAPHTLVTTYRESKRETQMITSFLGSWHSNLWQHEVWPQGGGFRFRSSTNPQSLVSELVLSNRELLQPQGSKQGQQQWPIFVKIFLDFPINNSKGCFSCLLLEFLLDSLMQMSGFSCLLGMQQAFCVGP